MSNPPLVRRIAPGIVSTVAMIAAMLSATAAHADTIAEDQSAEDIIVTGRALQGIQLDKLSSGSRLGITILQTPSTVNVLDGDTIRDRVITSLYKAETQAPGVTSQSTPGNGLGGLAYRGFVGVGSVQVVYDGLQLQVGAGTMSFPFDPWNVERVEVLGGPATALYGYGGLGGTVNVIPRSPATDRTRGEFQVSGGSFNSFRQAAGLTGPIGDKLAYRIDVSHQTSDGYVDRGDSNSLAISARLQYQPTPELKLTIANDYGRIEPMNYWGTPLINGVFVKSIRKRNFEVEDDRILFRDNIGQFKQEWTPSSDFSVTNTAYALTTRRHWRQLTNYTYVPATGLINRTSYREVFHWQDQFGDQLNATGKFKLFGLENTTSVGAQYEYIRFSTANNTPFTGSSSVDPYNPVPGFFNYGVGTNNQYRTRTDHFAVFGENRLVLLPQLSVVGGVRYDVFKLRNDNLTIGTPVYDRGANFEKTFKPFSWRVGTVFNPLDTLSFYVNYATGVDALGNLISTSYANRNFGLANGYQVEVGAKQTFLGGRGQWTVALYKIVKKDLLAPDPLNPTVSIQIGQQSSIGIEGSLSLQVTKAFGLQANGTILRARYDRFDELVGGVRTSRDGNRPSFAANSSANLFATWTFAEQLQLRGGLQYVGQRYANTANTFILPRYATVDAGLRVQVTPRIYADIKADNLLNKDYALTGVSGFSQYVLGPPRQLMVTTGYKF